MNILEFFQGLYTFTITEPEIVVGRLFLLALRF